MTKKPEQPTLPLEALERIDAVCLEFEAAWKSGRQAPRIEDFVGDARGPERFQLLRELLLLELHYRRRGGETPAEGDYRARFPRDRAAVDRAFEVTADAVRSGSLEDHPESIGPFRVLEKLGEGGMGIVYLAEQKEPIRRRVALKLIKLGMDTKEVLARFEAERQALVLMNHPNIASAISAGVTKKGRPFFVMEHVAGDPVTEYCDRQRLDVRGRLELFLSICAAIAHAHGKGVIHRDIKPTNVLVSVQGDRAVAKVIDFGVAKATNQRLTEMTLCTQQGQIVGTPEYMSPEQAELLDSGIDARSDVYSLGVLLYELLSGAPPFDPSRLRQSGYDEMVRIICEEEPSRPSRRISGAGDDGALLVAARRRREPGGLQRDLQGDLDWITLKALAKERDGRYESVKALAADVERHLRHEPVKAGPPGVVYPLRKLVRRNRRAAFVGSVLGIALLTVAALWGHRYLKDLERERLGLAAEHASRAAGLMSGGQVEPALEAYRRSIELDPHSVSTRVSLAQALIALRRVDEAFAECVRALELEPDSETIAEKVADILREHDVAIEGHLETLFSILDRQLDATKKSWSSQALPVSVARAAVRSSAKQYLDRALRYVERAVEKSERQDHEFVLVCSEVFVAAGRKREAVRELEKGLARDRDNQEYEKALRSLRATLLPELVSCGSVDALIEARQAERDLVATRAIRVLELAGTEEARDALADLSNDVSRNVSVAARGALSRLPPANVTAENAERDSPQSADIDTTDGSEPRLVFSDDFEGGARLEWSERKTDTTPKGGRQFLGQFGNERVTLSLGQLPAHQIVVLAFDLYVIRSWDGNHAASGPDIFELSVEGGPFLFRTSLCNIRLHSGHLQSYPDSYGAAAYSPYTGAAEINALGYERPRGPRDAVYGVKVAFAHSSRSLDIHFSATLVETGKSASKGLDNESWGVDNVNVELRPRAPTLDAGELETLWSNLTGADPVAANTAVWKLVERAPSAIGFVAGRLASDPVASSLKAHLESVERDGLPDEAGVLAYFRGRIHELAGDRVAAGRAFEEAIGRERTSPEPYHRLAQNLRAAGKSRAAAERLHAALAGSIEPYWRLLDEWFSIVASDLGWSVEAIRDGLPDPGASDDRSLDDLRWALGQIVTKGALRLNCGGEEFADSSGAVWGRDRFYSPTGYRFFGDRHGGAKAPFTGDISGTEDDPIYQTERWYRGGGGNYRIPLPRGSYRVVLHFSEIFEFHARVGGRVFGIAVEGKGLEDGFDLFATAGFAMPVTRSLDDLEVSDGFLDIEFVRIKAEPKISGIEIFARE